MTDTVLHAKIARVLKNQALMFILLNSIWKNTFPFVEVYDNVTPHVYTPQGLIPTDDLIKMVEEAYEKTMDFFEEINDEK